MFSTMRSAAVLAYGIFARLMVRLRKELGDA